MYHFVSEQTPELRLSETVLISSHTTQYLKCFQLDAVRFLHDRLSKQEFCIFNDESGLGKCVSIVALLNALGSSKKTLIVLQNDDQLLAGWQFHLGVLTDLAVCVLKDVNDSTESAHSVYLSKWSILRSIGDLSKLKFDYIIVDHRGYTLNNNFCTSMLLKQYERKVNIVISSVDITSDVKLLYNILRLGGCLEHQYKTFQNFERKFHLPDVKEVLSKRVDLEEYYMQRGILGEYIKEFRLRRYCHQFESYLPLVTTDQYKINLSLWLAENNSNCTIESSSEPLSTGSTDEIYECLLKLNEEREDPEKMSVSEDSEDIIGMEPLVLQLSESEAEEIAEEQVAETNNVVLLSSDDCEIVTPPTTPKPITSPATKSKRKYSKRLQFSTEADLSESEAEEATSTPTKNRKLNVRLTRFKVPQEAVATNSKATVASKKQERKTMSPQTVDLATKTTANKTAKETQRVPEEVATSSKHITPKQSAELKNAAVALKKTEEQKTTSPRIVELTTKTSNKKTAKQTQRVPEEVPKNSKKKSPELKTQLKPTSIASEQLEVQTNSLSSQTVELATKKTTEKTIPLKTTNAAKTPIVASKKSPQLTHTTPQKQKTAAKSTETAKTAAEKKQEQKTTMKTNQLNKTQAKKPEESTIEQPEQLKTPTRSKSSPATTKKTPEHQNKTPEQQKRTPTTAAKQDKLITPKTEPRSRRSHLRDTNPDEVELRQTRGMQRLTRSADSKKGKYMAPLKSLEFEKRVSPRVKRKIEVKEEATVTPKKSKSTTPTEEQPIAKRVRARGRPPTKQLTNETQILSSSKKQQQKTVTPIVATPDLLSSGSTHSDYSYMQCAQKLPDNLTEMESFSNFRIPQAPRAPSPLMLPSTLNFFSDSEVIHVPNSNAKPELVVINSSNDESSQQSTNQSRRTRALKRKISNSNKDQSQPSTSSFGLLLAQQRMGANKSPDIFSSCSDLSQITLAQPLPPASPFEGFKIFGSEVKQLQQQHAKAQPSNANKKHRERSCLDLLENMFESNKAKGSETGISLLPSLLSPRKQVPERRFTLLDDDIFEITNNGEFGSRLRLNSTGDVSPVHHQQQTQQMPQQRNKITKYLISSGCTPEDAVQQRTQPCQAQRKSPKSIKSTQSTKLTRWFNSSLASGSQSAPSTPVVPADKTNAARVARSGGATKRKQLNLYK